MSLTFKAHVSQQSRADCRTVYSSFGWEIDIVLTPLVMEFEKGQLRSLNFC